jgi:Tannase and feruloyl esterase
MRRGYRSEKLSSLFAAATLLFLVYSSPNAAAATLACDVAALQATLPASLKASINSASLQSTPVTYCDVIGAIPTSTYGQPGLVEFEVVLPATWNGRFVFAGGGGYVGSLLVGAADFPVALEEGYAAATTDAGHARIPRSSVSMDLPGSVHEVLLI